MSPNLAGCPTSWLTCLACHGCHVLHMSCFEVFEAECTKVHQILQNFAHGQNNIIARNSNGVYEGVAIGGDRHGRPGSFQV